MTSTSSRAARHQTCDPSDRGLSPHLSGAKNCPNERDYGLYDGMLSECSAPGASILILFRLTFLVNPTPPVSASSASCPQTYTTQGTFDSIMPEENVENFTTWTASQCTLGNLAPLELHLRHQIGFSELQKLRKAGRHLRG